MSEVELESGVDSDNENFDFEHQDQVWIIQNKDKNRSSSQHYFRHSLSIFCYILTNVEMLETTNKFFMNK